METIVSCFTEDAHVVGASTDEIASGLAAIHNAMKDGLSAVPHVFKKETEVLFLQERNECLVEVSAKFHLLSRQDEMLLEPFYVTATCVKENCQWKIAFAHASVSGVHIEKHSLQIKLQNVIDAIPGGVAIYKVSNIFETKYFSKGVPELSGYTVEEYNQMIKSDAAQMIHPDDADMVIQKLRSAIAGNTTADFEFRKNHKNGKVIWVRIQAKVLDYEDGHPLLHCVFHNITARKEAELDLKKANEQIQNIVNAIPGGMLIYRFARRLTQRTFYSDGFAQIMGYTRDEFEQIYPDDKGHLAVWEKDLPLLEQSCLLAVKTGAPVQATYRLKHKNGSLIWVNHCGNIVKENGSNLHYATITQVSPEAKMFRDIALHSTNGIYVLAKDSHKILFANEVMRQFMPKGDGRGQSCYSYLQGYDKPCPFCICFGGKELGKTHEIYIPARGYYSIRSEEIMWEDTPAYIQYINDITDEVKARQEKENLFIKMETIYRTMQGAVVKLKNDNGWTVAECNEKFYDMIGYTAEEFEKQHKSQLYKIIHPDYWDKCNLIKSRLGGKSAGSNENCFVKKDGSLVYVWVNGEFLKENDNGYVYVTLTDITQRKNYEKERERLLADYANTLDNSPGGLITMEFDANEKPTPIFVSQGFLSITKMTEEQFYRKYQNDVFSGLHPGDRERIIESFNTLKNPGDHFDNTYRLICGDGSYVWVQVTSTLAEQEGKNMLYTGYLDVTDSIETQQEIQRLYDNIPGAVFRCRFTKDWDVLDANDGLFEFLGYTREEFAAMGNKMSSVIYPDDLTIMMPKIKGQLKNGNTLVENENRLICKDGTVKWISVKAQLLTDEKGEQFFYCVFVDITRRMEAQQKEYLQQQAMELAIDHSNLMYWEYDITRQTAYMGQKVQDNFGVPRVIRSFPEEWLKLGHIHTEDIKIYKEAFDNMDKGSMQEEFNARAKIPNTTNWIWLNTRCKVVCDDKGTPVKAICTAEDIDRYKELEQTFFEIMRQNGVSSWKYNLEDHSVIYCENSSNAYGLESYIVPNMPESSIEKNIFHPDDVIGVREIFRRMHEGENEVSGQFRIYNKRLNDYLWMKISYTVLVDSDGSRRTALGSAMDITRQVQQKRKYEEMLLLHRNNQNPNTLLIAYCSLKDNKIKEINDATGHSLETRFGLLRDEFFVQFAELIVNKEEQQEFLDTMLAKPLLADFAK